MALIYLILRQIVSAHALPCIRLNMISLSLQADVTPERQVILDRLSSGKVFPPSSSSLGQSGDNSSSDTTTMIGSVYGNGSPRMPNDLPAQPSFVTSER